MGSDTSETSCGRGGVERKCLAFSIQWSVRWILYVLRVLHCCLIRVCNLTCDIKGRSLAEGVGDKMTGKVSVSKRRLDSVMIRTDHPKVFG